MKQQAKYTKRDNYLITIMEDFIPKWDKIV